MCSHLVKAHKALYNADDALELAIADVAKHVQQCDVDPQVFEALAMLRSMRQQFMQAYVMLGPVHVGT